MAGYSKRSLADKLGLKPGQRVVVAHAPEGYFAQLGTLPEGVEVRNLVKGPYDFGHYFALSKAALTKDLKALRRGLDDKGCLWISWPKAAAKVPTDVTESVVRGLGLAAGLVDVKVAAVDETWSGLKFMVRLRDRR